MIVDDVARWNAAHILFSVSMALTIPAVLGLVRLPGRRGAWFGLMGGTLAAVGVAFFGIFIGVELAMSAIASVPLEQRAGLLVVLGAVGLRTLAGRSYEACERRQRRAHTSEDKH